MRLTPQTRASVLLFLVLLPVYLLTMNERVSRDAESAHFGSWNLVSTGEPWIEDTGYLAGHELRHIWVGEHGEHEVVTRSPGVIAASIPAYAVARLENFSPMPGSFSAAVITAWGVCLMFAALAVSLPRKHALVAALILGLGTPVWSVSADAMWPHTLTVFAIGGMSWALATRRWWAVGLFGGVGLWGRVHLSLMVAVIGVLMAFWRREWHPFVKVGAASGAMLALMTVWSRWLFGEWRVTGSYAVDSVGGLSERYDSLLVNELGLFFALERGILVWSPVLLLLVPSVVRAWRHLPQWPKAVLLGGTVYTLAQGYANVFHGGDSFWGYRLGLEFVASCVPVLAYSFPWAGRAARALIGPLTVLQIGVIGMGASLGLGGAPAEDAWWANSVAVVILHAPMAGMVLLAAVMAVGWAAGRLVGGAPAPQDQQQDQWNPDAPVVPSGMTR